MSVVAVALVGNHLRHRWFASRLAAEPAIELRGVVRERQPPEPRGDALVEEHFADRRQAEERLFGQPGELGLPLLAVERGETNTDRAAAWVRARDPDYLVLFGCGIIRSPLADLYPERMVNLHLGLSPYYRGHATNFWPLVEGVPECVGATVHLATSDVDAGEILRQARPAVAAADGPHDVGCKALIGGTDALIASLPEYARGTLAPVPQAAGGKVYRHADFDAAAADAIAELRRRFADGMIPEYLARKPERDARFPIVE